MPQLGIDGIRRRKKRLKTDSVRAEACPNDLVEGEFAAPAHNYLWVSDILCYMTLLNRVEVRDRYLLTVPAVR